MRRNPSDESSLRRQLCAYAADIWQRGLGAAGDGNLSVRLGGDRVLTTPSACHKGKLRPEDLVVVDLGGTVRGPGRPSSELVLHLAAYRARAEIGAVIHAHPPHAVALQLAGIPLSELYVSEVVFAFGQPATAPYTTPTTAEVGDTLATYLRCHDVVLMPRHGSVTVGPDLATAFLRLDALEHTARIVALAKSLGAPAPIDAAEVDRLFRVAGRSRPASSCPPLEPPASAAEASLPPHDDALVRAVLARLAAGGGP